MSKRNITLWFAEKRSCRHLELYKWSLRNREAEWAIKLTLWDIDTRLVTLFNSRLFEFLQKFSIYRTFLPKNQSPPRTHDTVFCATLGTFFDIENGVNTKSGTKRTVNMGYLIFFLVFHSAFGRHRYWLRLKRRRIVEEDEEGEDQEEKKKKNKTVIMMIMMMCYVVISNAICRGPSWLPKTKPNVSCLNGDWCRFWYSTQFSISKKVPQQPM